MNLLILTNLNRWPCQLVVNGTTCAAQRFLSRQHRSFAGLNNVIACGRSWRQLHDRAPILTGVSRVAAVDCPLSQSFSDPLQTERTAQSAGESIA